VLGDRENQATSNSRCQPPEGTGDAIELMSASKALVGNLSDATGDLSKRLIAQTDNLEKVLSELN